MKTGIIIPTKNEEFNLPFLLQSIKKQSYKNYILIVADAFSEDRTTEVAQEYSAIVVTGGMPAVGRNNGAVEAIKWGCELLLFIDADIILPDTAFLERAVAEIKQRKLDVAGTFQKPYSIGNKNTVSLSKNLFYWSIYSVSNSGMYFFQWTKRPMFQVCMFATTNANKQIGGFKNMEYGEDIQYAADAGKLGLKFRMLSYPAKVWISPRRFREKGFFKSGTPYFLLHSLMGKRFEYGKTQRKYF
jgi:glycosyltransferase involved in cell wall biosynthesis